MSDGKKFIKTDANLSPEDRLAVVERNYSVILSRIQSYDQVLMEFANINSDLQSSKQSIGKFESQLTTLSTSVKERLDNLNTRINEIKKNQDLIVSSLADQRLLQQQTSALLKTLNDGLQHDIDVLHANDKQKEIKQSKHEQSLSDLEKSLSNLKDSFTLNASSLSSICKEQSVFKDHIEASYTGLKAQIDQLLSSFQELPQFNEWATKIYIKVCNDISDKQKQFYYELDKRSQELKQQLASDPYTAESVKKILKDEMDAMAMDGKNAYLKATNASQQIQLLEKKIENINLILKKYELSK